VIVDEVFEVMAQVDHDLTTVNRFDQHLGLIKNLGRQRLGRVGGGRWSAARSPPAVGGVGGRRWRVGIGARRSSG
jgi:hypothetical protein